MNQDLFKEVTDWQEATFEVIETQGLLNHLGQEVKEAYYAVRYGHNEKHLEFADCFILLMGAAKADGMSYEDICQAISEKLEINKKRVWGEPDSNGVINHVKEEDLVCCANCEKLVKFYENMSGVWTMEHKCTLNPEQPVKIQSSNTHSCTNFKKR